MSGYALGQPLGHGATEQTTIDGDPPAAGNSFSYSFRDFDRGRLVFATFKLHTDANAANRYVTVEYPDSSNLARSADGAAVVVTANTSSQRFCGSLNRGQSEWAANTDVFFPLSGIWLEAGQPVKINVANIQAGDTLTAIRLTFDRFMAVSQRPHREHGPE